MRVFVTGATGFIGTAVVRELLGSGHSVLGLARSDSNAQALLDAGAEVHRGDLNDPDSLRDGAADSDGVIHTAFNHDFTKYRESCENDRRVIQTLGAALAGSSRPLIVTSGTALIRTGRIATETDSTPSSSEVPRAASEEAASAVAAQGVNASIVRLSPTVHGEHDTGFVPLLIKLAREKNVSAYVGDGSNRWPAVHRLDAARVFRLALEKNAAGARYHAVAEQGIEFRKIAETIGRHLNVPAVGKSGAEVESHFGWFATFAAIDNPSSSKLTQEQLGWQPTQIELLDDLEAGHYFKST